MDDIRTCFQQVSPRVSKGMNEDLLKVFTYMEIKEALFEIAPLESQVLMGLEPYCTKYLEVIGDKMCTIVQKFLNGGTLPPSINSTFSALVLKVHHPTSINEFRPINLCNFLYKIIAKTLKNRLKRVLPSIISLNQSIFIPSRLILDNIIIAYDALHSMKIRKKEKMGNMAVKVDIYKAYDKVDWRFLLQIMEKLGFGQNGFL